MGLLRRSGEGQNDQIRQLAAEKLTKVGRAMVWRELGKVTGLLGEGEEVLNLAEGRYDDHAGLLVVTDRRVIFTEQGVVRGRQEDFAYGRISSVQTGKGLGMSKRAIATGGIKTAGELTIYASGNKAAITKVLPAQRAAEIGDYIRSRIDADAPASATSPAPPPSSPPDGAPTPAERLTKLAELRTAGLLTEEEYQAKRAEVLAEL